MRMSLTRRSFAVLIGALLTLGRSAPAPAQCPHQGLASFGPISAATFEYPAYYVDQQGLALGTCFDTANLLCGLAPLPDPALPPDIATGNFFDEHLYTFVTADVPMPGGGIGLIVLSVVGTFGNALGAVVPGDQVVFSRIRFRIDTPAAGTYTMTHPFGQHVLTAAAPGRRSINFTDDCLLSVPPTCGAAGLNAFITPLAPFSWISNWLTWDATPPAPPAGHIGDPALLHTITGSPCGTNFFRVEGPGLPAGGVTTNLWSVLGKKAAICGNGILDAGEQCDDGNTLAGDCCAPTCQFEANGSPCDDGNLCTDATTCNGAGLCGGGTFNTAPCTDGNACTTGDACSGGVCVGGPAPNCDDGNVCTTDSCTPPTGCAHAPNTLPCDDGNPCTLGDTCAAGACQAGPVRNCNDNNVCTADACNPATGLCVNTANTAPCNDGNPCTGNDTCANGVCVGVPIPCTPSAVVGTVLADATVDSSLPTTPQGTKTQINVDAGPTIKRAFMRVQVSGVGTQQVTAAHLQLKAATTTNAQSVSGGQIHRISNCTWNESTITFNNQPPIDGPVLSTVGAVALGQVVDFNLAAAITGDGVYCFAIDSLSTDGVDYVSREATTGKPVLTVTAACACAPACTPTTCTAQGKNCGNIPNGCGGTLTCGTCTAPQTCGGGGVTNVCGAPACTPTTCAAQGKNCGTIPDGCGGTLTCGTCTAPQTCGGGGVTNVCGAPAAAATATVVADATVDSSLPTTPQGTKTQINVDAGPTVKRAFLRVQVSNVGTRQVTAAQLNLKAATTTNAQSVTGGQIHKITSCTWSETAITFNNQPAIDGPVLSSLGAVALGQAVSFDLAGAITGDGTYCFAIDSLSTDGVDYNSREASAGKPTVTLTVTP